MLSYIPTAMANALFRPDIPMDCGVDCPPRTVQIGEREVALRVAQGSTREGALAIRHDDDLAPGAGYGFTTLRGDKGLARQICRPRGAEQER